MPAISILLPLAPGAAAADTVRDLLGQASADLEVLLLSSADPGLGGDDRLRLIRTESGADPGAAALNAGLAAAQGALLARATVGDRSAPDRLARQAALLRASAELAFVATGWRLLATDGTVLRTARPPARPAALRDAMAAGDVIGHPTALMRRDAVLRAGGWRPAFAELADYDLALRLLDRHPGTGMPEPLLDHVADPATPAWRAMQSRAVAELAAIAAHDRRQAGRADAGDGVAPADRALLHAMGMPDEEITRLLLERAMSLATASGHAGNWPAMREAARFGLEQPGAPASARSALRRLWLRSLARLPP